MRHHRGVDVVFQFIATFEALLPIMLEKVTVDGSEDINRDERICLRPLAGLFYPEKLANLATNLKEIYIYFNNDTEAFAVRNAVTLRGYLQTRRD